MRPGWYTVNTVANYNLSGSESVHLLWASSTFRAKSLGGWTTALHAWLVTNCSTEEDWGIWVVCKPCHKILDNKHSCNICVGIFVTVPVGPSLQSLLPCCSHFKFSLWRAMDKNIDIRGTYLFYQPQTKTLETSFLPLVSTQRIDEGKYGD